MLKLKIDYAELNKQNMQEILKSGKYVRVEIIVGEDNQMPYTNFEVRNTNSKTITAMHVILEGMQEMIFEQFPETRKLLQFFDIKKIDPDDEFGVEEDES